MDKDKEIPAAATVLTDERIGQIYQEGYDDFAGPKQFRHATNHQDYHAAGLKAVRCAIEAEVLAQAGVRAEPAFWYDARAKIEKMDLIDGAYQAYLLVCNEKFGDYTTPLYLAAPTIPAQVPAAEEVLALHRQLAAEKLRADQGWERAEAKSKECIELRERMAAQVPAAEVRADELPAILFDSYAVYEEVIKQDQPPMVGPKGVADTLDAVVRLMRKEGADKASEVRAAEWISVEDRLPEVGQLVLVYSPPTKFDYPDSVNIGFDCIDPNDDDHASWLNHNEHYEHFCCVAKPEGSVGPSAEAPYTHWMPLPAAPSTAESGNTGALGEGADRA